MRKGKKVAIFGVFAMVASLMMVVPALASHPQQIIPGSDSKFEIDTNANLVVDDAGNDDWVSIPQGNVTGTERRQLDTASGSGDESFGNGTKEDTAIPSVVTGGIPPNKSDLKAFGGYLETTPTGKFLNIYWTRVQDPSGTTNMDFEFNKSSTISANGVTPVRTAGDVLIQYDLSNGGTNPTLFISRWLTGAGACQAGNQKPCWSTKVNLSAAGDAVGSINTTAIVNLPGTPVDETDGLGSGSPSTLSARTFGEAQIDFAAFSGGAGTCVNFGSAYLKSRSSDSFTSALKDFIPPLTLNFSNCGNLKIVKTDDATPGNPLEGAEFEVRNDLAPLGTAPGPEDTLAGTCTTDTNGECNFTDLFQGDYWVIETVAPAGHSLPDPAFQLVTVTVDSTVEVPFVNVPDEGAIQITKTEKHAAATGGSRPGEGVTFTIEGGDLPAGGTEVVTGANGVVCLDGLDFATDYTVTETEKDDYNAVGDGVQEVTVDNKATCADDPFVGEEVSFDNVPLTDVTVTVDSLVPGGTASTITCDDPDASTADTDAVTGDGSLVLSDQEPGLITCTIDIDP